VFELIEAHGRLPLPPYIEHTADEFDEQRYQTVYSKEPGAVAAPTAGLHFDQPLLDKLAGQRRELRLRHPARGRRHLPAGAGRRPVAAQHAHRVVHHRPGDGGRRARRESGRPRRGRGRHHLLRALESASQSGELVAGSADTALFITPGYKFKTVTRLITNFHLPKSTLLMLVSAFAGYAEIRKAYAHAIANEYRFFSYGDAMLLTTQSRQ
jgi:S-adenosylmethionine:tRNA ribosyltransferase-isomerase